MVQDQSQPSIPSTRMLEGIGILLLASFACGLPRYLVQEEPTRTPTPRIAIVLATTEVLATVPTATATAHPTITVRANPSSTVVPSAFDIDYAHPESYLIPGDQSRISDTSCLAELQTGEHSLAHLARIYRWLKNDFTNYSAGGRTIGVVDVDQLLAERRLGGCHDCGLVYAAVARALGYPTVMMHTNSIAWMERFQAGEGELHVGHVFVEVYLDDRWMLVDPTNGWYVDAGYDPTDPVIPLKGSVAGSDEEAYGFYVECKGLDIWDFGVHSKEQTHQAMDALAQRLDLTTIEYPAYVFQHFSELTGDG
jgi:hypothetical protein